MKKTCANFKNSFRKQIENGVAFGIPVVVAVNSFVTDTEAEVELVKKLAKDAGATDAVLCTHWADGGKGAFELAKAVKTATDMESKFEFTYPLQLPIEEKIRMIARNIYGADDIELMDQAKKNIELFTKQGFNDLPICMAKTQYSLSHDASKKVCSI